MKYEIAIFTEENTANCYKVIIRYIFFLVGKSYVKEM